MQHTGAHSFANANFGNQFTHPSQQQHVGGAFIHPDNIGVSNTGLTNNWLRSRDNSQLFTENYADYKLIDNQDADFGSEMGYNIMKIHNKQASPVSKLFFSKMNVDHLKVLIAKQVKKHTGYVINALAQSTDVLVTLMSTVYNDHAKNQPTMVREQVGELNRVVLQEILPTTIANIKMKLTYIRDQGSQPLPIAHPVNPSSAGTRQNRSVADLFF